MVSELIRCTDAAHGDNLSSLLLDAHATMLYKKPMSQRLKVAFESLPSKVEEAWLESLAKD